MNASQHTASATLRRATILSGTALALALSACSTPAPPAGTGEPRPVTPVPTAAASPTPDATASEGASPAPTTAATPTPTAASDPVERPAVRGEAGGSVTWNGQQVGRGGEGSTEAFVAAMGTPDETTQSGTCGSHPLKNTQHRWGDLKVIILDEEDTSNEYGFAYPAGDIAGWVIDPTLDGAAGVTGDLTGPEGITIGTPLATLESTFTHDEWSSADRFEDFFEIFVGDTTGASFRLTQDDTVDRMAAGYTCPSDS